MKCPKCQSENREGIKFCEDCGTKFELQCPACQAKIPLGKKFCGECGLKLGTPFELPPQDLSFDEKIEKLQRYLPQGLTEKILSQRDRIEGERKQVTVMFCDMEGFTALTEKLGPEEAYSIMDQVYEILIHKVHDYEGTVNEMTGDGILALFGAPIALEDAPQRAIRSSLAIHRAMAKFNQKRKQDGRNLPSLKMRIGIHTGTVVVGTLGNDLRVEFKAVGDTVNLASRMEGLARPATTFITNDTFKLTEGLFRFEALGSKKVKGKDEPVNVYQVIAPSNRRTRFDVSAERGLTPLVGRKRELELLFDGFERAKAGRGQAVSIMSEAGFGKSRILYEFRKTIENEDVTFLEGKCLSYSKHAAYHPVIDILKSTFNVIDGDGDAEVKKKVTEGLRVLGVKEESVLPYILQLLSVKDSGLNNILISPEAKKDRFIEALKIIVLMGSKLRPLILAIEDLHWIDKSSEELLQYLLDDISGNRVFLIFTYRPEYVPFWGVKSYHSQVNLNRLANSESIAMVAHFLGTEGIGQDMEELILEKTEGVPFFVEEFIRSLKDLKVIERKDDKYHFVKKVENLTIPSTIQDIIMARVDSLPESAKEILQVGSVVEREFSHGLIKHLTSLPEKELLAVFATLKDSELIYERGIYPENTYIFKHALTREVVYNSLLTPKKQALHAEIGNAIEKLYSEELSQHYGVLAEHFLEGHNYVKGSKYAKLAGRKAINGSAFTEAVLYAQKSTFCIEKLPQNEKNQRKLIDARTAQGTYYSMMNYHVEAKEAVDPIVESAIQLDYKKRLIQIYIILGTYYCMVDDEFEKAFAYLEKGLNLSEETQDYFSLVNASFWLGLARSYNCEFDKSRSVSEKGLELVTAVNNLTWISAFKGNMGVFAFLLNGKTDIGYQFSKESVEIAEENNDIFSKGIAYTSLGFAFYDKGLITETLKNMQIATDYLQKTKFYSWDSIAQHVIGEIYLRQKSLQEARDHFKKAIALCEKNRLMPAWINLNELCLALISIRDHKSEFSLELLYSYIQLNKYKMLDGWMRRYLAEILLNMNGHHLSEAENWIQKAIEEDRRNNMGSHLAKDYALYSEIMQRKGDLSKTKEYLGKAIETFKQCGADGWVEKYEKELASLQ